MANLEIKLSANKRQPYLRHRVVGRVGDGGLTTINVQLLEEDEITPFVINLNGTLKFVGEVSNGNYTEGEPEIIDSTNGLISYTFTKSNFSTSHQFKQAYFEYVDPNGKKVTFQNFIIDVLERVDINSEQAKYYISSLEKLQSEMQTTFNQFISDKQVQYDQIYSKYNELVRLINESDKQVNDRIDKANNRIDQTNQQIGDLGKLKKMYSNSINFGDYDYSGNPNLLSKLSYDLIENQNTSAGTLSKGENSFKYNKISAEVEGGVELYYKRRGIANWLPSNKTLVMTVKLRAGADYSPVDGKLILIRYRYVDSGTGKIVLDLPINSNSITQEWKEFSITGTTPTFSPQAYHPWIQFRAQDGILGEIEMSYDIKIEEGSTATPYQPNLLDAPYYLSKVALGENLIKPESQQPVTNSNYLINTYNIKPMVKGKKYTITLEGTKPATQVFRPFFTRATGDAWEVGDLQPVEGLTNVWSKTFTAADDSHPTTPQVQIYQVPSTSVGQCTIKWLKLEEGNTRTPNISQFKYFGEGLKDSNNPNDYSWDVTPEYTEKGLNDTVSLTEPQSIEGLKNFEDGIQSKGKSVLTSDDNKYEVVTLTVTNGNTGSAKLYREGKTVTIYFFALNGKSSGGNDSTILTIPEGYRPPISFEQLVGSIDRSTLNSAQLSIGADGAIKWRRNSSYGSDYTFAITYTI
ncbi:TPA: BppU family phage baseplate upper protein [Enterococcus faecium]|uniref:BppU family phage baseplate upper protein n=1 Tax=Enterococcus faecium TaxID=1352 RepID=UPI001C691006|nr:BppU family phage baseplate upper protein [Enterococcus faecium]HAZ0889422.1 BppU family phage baseplate upper protein [Enterococcus faecium]HAZ0897829.1 BppU family phage baseplate upper protein [Enterococcus faecium]HAZ0937148.1 BppU family phage baseplate upper protein [Enterococcus faecium]HAZ0945322.1 BppU family phage baseplate upper protein [Enterococcus faecium]HAZ0970957.1 BppU family phage baseplate upper protein [Enterococcus faecium]